MFTPFAWLIDTFYGWTHSYGVAIALVAFAIMVVIAPLTMKSTKGMLEMQRLQPEMKKLQNQFKGDRQQLNTEMMKLYQEHKVNPLASCLPLMAQMPVFIIMFRVLRGLSKLGTDGTFNPSYIAKDSKLYLALDKSKEMLAFIKANLSSFTEQEKEISTYFFNDDNAVLEEAATHFELGLDETGSIIAKTIRKIRHLKRYNKS